MSAARSLELDAAVKRRDRGRLLIGGTPPRLLRLSEAGARALDRILAGAELDAAAAKLASRLESHGLLHPLPADGRDDPEVTTIVPVLNGGERLTALIATLVAEGPTIVVDDGSTDGSGARAAAAGARVLRHETARGPAAARNAGLAAAGTGLVAFLDADCEPAPGWRRGLARLLAADPDLALVAPRVRSAPGASPLARYEEEASPLDLGPAGGLVGPQRRVTYLPAAALVGRRDALLGLAGFDESMRFGEDVDLVWRLLDAGWRVRYLPRREVQHRPRDGAVAFARQRAGYGGSAPELVRRHGSAAAPLRVSRHSVLIWGAALLGPRALLPALAASTTLVARGGADRGARAALVEIALRGQADATVHLAHVLTREWLPPALLAAPFSHRARRALLAAFIVDSFPAWAAATAGPPAEVLRATALHALDRLAYSAGMWREMARGRDFTALRPRPARAATRS